MPRPGHLWRHVIISTLNSWLPGDERGFRTRKHKLHSSGDYKKPPPPGEHAGLHQYSKTISGAPVIIPTAIRGLIGQKILHNLSKRGLRVLAVSVGGMHAHLHVELPSDKRGAADVIGQCKSVSSHAVRRVLPGRVWAIGGKYNPVRDKTHAARVYRYILDHTNEGAWVWSYTQGMPGGCDAP